MKVIAQISTFLLFLCICQVTLCQTLITVKQDGTGDYTTIQDGVDSAMNGDTVLVWPGTYYENVTVENKNLILGSLALTSGNLVYVKQTIINGNQNSSCLVLINTLDTCLIYGFTLTNGSGYYTGDYSGGGVHIRYSFACIKNCEIQDNYVTGSGGGIYTYNSYLDLGGVTIRRNTAFQGGGGIIVAKSEVDFDTINLNNIYLNYAAYGTDVVKGLGDSSLHVVVDTFTVQNPDYYYLYSYANGILQDDITWQVNSAKIQQTDQNLYVSPFGDNNHDGISPQSALKDIWFALLKMKSDSVSPDTIHVAPGSYKLSTGEKFPLSLKRYASIKGLSSDSCILDAEEEIYHFYGIIGSNDFQISNLSLQFCNSYKNCFYNPPAIEIKSSPNSGLKNLVVRYNKTVTRTIGISNSNGFSMRNCQIIENTGGRGFSIVHGDEGSELINVDIFNCIIRNNLPNYSMPAVDGFNGGGGRIMGKQNAPGLLNVIIYNSLFIENRTRPHPDGTGHGSVALSLFYGAKCNLVNCTFGDNEYDGSLGGNIGVTNNSELNIYNSIMHSNSPAELYMYNLKGANSLNIYNSVVQGGEDGIRIYTGNNTLYYDPSNIDTDPMWDTISMYPYSLSAGSPCINAGTLDLPPDVELPETDLAGNPRVYDGYIDMGAYEYGPWVGIDNYHPTSDTQNIKLLSAWPNPFRFETNISYTVPEKGTAVIRVYDLNGRCLKTLMDVHGQAGEGQIQWRGTNDQGGTIKAGTYIISISINGEERDTVKVVKN